MTTESFIFNAHPARVLFGTKTIASLRQEVERLDLHRVFVLSTKAQAQDAQILVRSIGERCAGFFAEAAMHTPVDVTENALSIVLAGNADGLIAFGGGSTTGLSKAIALRTDLPQIVVPTTYAGSEVTPILGETKDGVKVTQVNMKVLPEVVIYDVDLTMGLPPLMSATSGLNAIAHAVEALYARDSNPVISLLALEAIGKLTAALPKIADNPNDGDARSDALYGAWLCGTCLGNVGMALHHKLCHTLGGSFDLPHAETHSIVLPHALAYNAPAIPDVMKKLSTLLGGDPATMLYELAQRIGVPSGLKSLGMAEKDIEEATDRALANPYWNPQPLERKELQQLFKRAWAGVPPVEFKGALS